MNMQVSPLVSEYNVVDSAEAMKDQVMMIFLGRLFKAMKMKMRAAVAVLTETAANSSSNFATFLLPTNLSFCKEAIKASCISGKTGLPWDVVGFCSNSALEL